MPYLFDDLRLSSFFSGIGAFECSLNLLYQRNINFDRSELNIKECEICGSSLRVKHNKTTHMFLCEKHCKRIYKYGEIIDSSSYNQNDKNEIKLYEDYAMLILKNKHGEEYEEAEDLKNNWDVLYTSILDLSETLTDMLGEIER